MIYYKKKTSSQGPVFCATEKELTYREGAHHKITNKKRLSFHYEWKIAFYDVLLNFKFTDVCF